MTQEQTAEEVLYCTVHPDRETTLRCNKCGRPMCVQCAVQTSVGYRCRECVRGIQDNYYTATQNDYIIIFAATAALTAVAAAIIAALNLGLLFAILLGLPAGGGIAELALRVTSRRRGRQSANIAVAGTLVGGILGGIVQTLLVFGGRLAEAGIPVFDFLLRRVTTDLGLLVFIGICAVAVYGRFKMRS